MGVQMECGSAGGAGLRWDGSQDGSDGKGEESRGDGGTPSYSEQSRAPACARGALQPIGWRQLDPGMQLIEDRLCASEVAWQTRGICPTERAKGHATAAQRRATADNGGERMVREKM